MGAKGEGEIQGHVAAVMILEPGAGIVSTVVDGVAVTADGFEGDRHAGKLRLASGRDPKELKGSMVPNRRQVSLVAEEELGEIARRLGVPRVEARWLGANLSLEGISNLTGLPRGARLMFEGGAVIVVDEENSPCTGPGEAIAAAYADSRQMAAQFPKLALHLRGVVGWVEKPGQIQQGDRVMVTLPSDQD